MLTTIIEKYLQAVDQATFQKMMNHLLYLDGFKFIGSPGSVVGKNKTSKGAPDSFFEVGDNFAFCEITTKEKLSTGQTFFNKLKADVAHCFDKTSTGIEAQNISKVILAFTEKIKPAELNKLKALVKSFNSNAELIIYSIQQIPFRILYIPGFAEKYIQGIKTTNGTLFMLPDFLQFTTKGLQPSLVNEFVGRGDEIKAIKEILSKEDVLIISGSAGVGKSKLAVHIAELLEAEEGLEPRVIAGSPVPLWDDLQTFLLPDKKYVVVFDDANKALNNLEYLFHFIQSREAGSIKVIITVRDYVRTELNKIVFDKKVNDFTLKTLEDDKIKEIINKIVPAGKTIDQYIMERILSLAKGNSRLALMAAKLIIDNNNAEVLNNVVNLYDEYFKKLQNEVAFLSKPEYLRALGILSFFGVMDKNDEELKKKLTENFDVNWDGIWEIYIELEQYELVDVFYKEAAKISDQVLATYVFYKAFIDQISCVIDYTAWIEHFLGVFDPKITKTLTDSINTFGFNELKDKLTTHIVGVQKKIEHDQDLSYKFYSIFWFYREVDTLQFIKRWIDSLEQEEVELSKMKFTYGNNDFTWPSEHISLLKNFWYHNTPVTKTAFELSFELMFKRPSMIPEVLKHLSENAAYHRYDYRDGYARQHIFFDVLLKPGYNEKQQFITNHIFLEKAGSFLGWDYNQIEGHGGGKMMIYNFFLVRNKGLLRLREKIMLKLFSMFKDHETKALELINTYIWGGREFDPKMYEFEQVMVTDFFKANFSDTNYAHCRLIHQYVETLEESKVTVLDDWSRFTNSESIKVARIFTATFDDLKTDYRKREADKLQQIQDLVKGKDISFIETTLTQVQSIYNKDVTKGEEHSITTNVTNLFRSLADQDAGLFYSALELLMQGKFEFNIYGNIIYYPIEKKLVNPRELYDHINRYDYKMKQNWKLAFFNAINKSETDEFLLQEFIGLMFSPSNIYISQLESFDKFTELFKNVKAKLPAPAQDHHNIITYIAQILLSKSPAVQVAFDHDVCEKSYPFFEGKAELLKQVYFLQKKNGNSYDYNGEEMEAVSKLDPLFLLEYLKESTKDDDYISSRFDHLDLGFIWDLPEYEQILDGTFEIIMPKAPVWSSMEHPLNMLFKGINAADHAEKARQYISKFIAKHHNSRQPILTILNVVTYSFTIDTIKFFREYLLLNKGTDILKGGLWLDRNEIMSGSMVPRLESNIKFFAEVIEMIKGLPNPLEYAEHIKYWEQQLEWAKKEKQEELKRDFKGWGE